MTHESRMIHVLEIVNFLGIYLLRKCDVLVNSRYSSCWMLRLRTFHFGLRPHPGARSRDVPMYSVKTTNQTEDGRPISASSAQAHA